LPPLNIIQAFILGNVKDWKWKGKDLRIEVVWILKNNESIVVNTIGL
jgi:hypothetical protein